MVDACSGAGAAMSVGEALLVIDVQTALLPNAFRAEEIMRVIATLQQRARDTGSPVIFLQHLHPDYAALMRVAAQWQIANEVAPRPGDVVIEKMASDGFYGTSLHTQLASLGVERLVACGMYTDYCVDATCRAALSHGYDVILAADAHAAAKDGVLPAEQVIAHHQHVLGRLAHPTRRINVHKSHDIAFRPPRK